MRIGLLAVGGWLVAAVLTVGVSWSAISVVRESVLAGPQLDNSLPTAEETTGPAPTATAPTASATSPRPSRTPPPARLVTGAGRGGTVVVRCDGGRPAFVNTSPRPGWSVEPDDSGDEVEFRSGSGRTEMTATCAGGVPTVRVEEKGGGDSGRGGGEDD